MFFVFVFVKNHVSRKETKNVLEQKKTCAYIMGGIFKHYTLIR